MTLTLEPYIFQSIQSIRSWRSQNAIHLVCSEGLPLLFCQPILLKETYIVRLILIIDDIVSEQRECLCHSYSIFSSVSICWVVPMVPQPLATTSTFREAFCSQKWRHSSHQVIFPISKCMLKMFLKFRDCIFSILFVPPKKHKNQPWSPRNPKHVFRQQIGL